MRLGVVLVAGLIAMGCQMKGLPGPEWSGKGWREITTPHFIIDTDLRDYRAMEIAKTLEVTRAAMLQVAFTGAPEPPGRTRVIAIERDHRGIFPGGVNGFNWASDPFERVIVFRSSDVERIPGTFHHELAHHLSHWYLPIQPAWFAEGLANYLQSVRVDFEKEEVSMGEPPKWIGHISPKRRMTTAEVIAFDSAHEGEDHDLDRSYYANAWLLVMHLLNHHSRAFGDFQEGIQRLENWRSVWKRTLPEPAVIDHEIQKHFEEKTFLVRTETFWPPTVEPAVRRLPPAEVSGLLAWLSLVNRDSEKTGSMVEEALREDPKNIHALALKFYGMTPPAQRPSVAQSATAAHPEHSLAWILAADAAADPDARLAALERARHVDPTLWSVRLRLAKEKIRRGRAAEALVDTRVALRAGDVFGDVVTAHLAALWANRRCRDANRLINNDLPEWSPADLEKLREFAPPERAWCTAHPDFNTPNAQLPTE